jgi:hypothetical protein
MVAELIERVETKLRDAEFKPTVTDFIRLIQIQKEFETEIPRDIEVTWIDAPFEIESDAA